MSTVSYVIDADDCLVQMGGDWDAFADRNGSPECFADELIGTHLFDAIADEMTAKLYRTIFAQVREVGKPFFNAISLRRRWCPSGNAHDRYPAATPTPVDCQRFGA